MRQCCLVQICLKVLGNAAGDLENVMFLMKLLQTLGKVPSFADYLQKRDI